jgi:hypothetical protein
MTEAMQSFLNAGYTPQEVELASKKINDADASVAQVSSTPTVSASISSNQKLPLVPQVTEAKKSYKGLIIGLLAALGIIIVALILLYLFQDAVF